MKEISGRKQGGMSPCAACKLLRRRCAQDCVFAPYFPADEPHKFASVHKVFGASNVNKMLQELPEHQRSDAVSSMVYEANARVRDPVYGCVGAISSLQQQIDVLQTQLAIAQAEVVHMKMNQLPSASPPAATSENTSPISVKQIMPNNNNSHHHYHPHQTTKSFFTMDMVVDQANSLWSC
ncbi:LOB domain-containing protein 4-like [Rosa rugosa]|uniref:LOB domain-containing protein 4-like n=1 Tax=Rosa rugosa TaxID=74645 RepID=UPI002B40A147|nr:LOB domain-containing protein 4-like [Rosa rugosa]